MSTNYPIRSLVLALIISLVALERPASADARLTQAQAIQIARSFCGQLGETPATPATAVYPAPDFLPEAPAYWQPRWRITFSDRTKVDVADGTGVVCDYFNPGLVDRLAKENTPAGIAIPEADAIEKARAALAATGQVGEMSFEYAWEAQHTSPPTVSGHDWTVKWHRVFQNMNYRDEYANVLLQAETGEVEGLVLMFPSQAPPAATITVSRDAAVQVAQSLVTGAGLSGAALFAVRTLVVHPNTFWQEGGSERVKLPGPARVAWVVSFQVGRDTCEAWIDAATGAVIGGTAIGTLSIHPRAGKAKVPERTKPPRAR